MQILVCLDGEPHTRGAVERAIELGLGEQATVTGLHVIDPWLRQFYSEIYAQGRKEYLEWVDHCLQDKAAAVREDFDSRCHARGLEARFVLRDGEPLAEILAAVHELSPDLVITGAKVLTGWHRLRSGKLPARLRRKLAATVALVAVVSNESGPGRSLAREPQLAGVARELR